ncbi:NAD(P)-dependent oxidoreductase [Candidatus Woesearchaeota archaeon]|nr:NAD(P)-dependent oxidoreductase [Candidatus Woesearchaeota archaeon]
MKKAFITGAAGFLGSHLVEQLSKKGYEITGLIKPHHNTEFIEKFKVKTIKGDLLKPETFARYIPKNCAVFHSYSLGPGAKASKEKYFLDNVEGTKNLLKACLKKKISKFVYIGSISAIGPNAEEGKPITEYTSPNPDNAYGESKLAAEKIVEDFAKKTKIPTAILRLSTLYGPRAKKNAATTKIFMLVKKPIFIVVGNGKNLYEFNYVKNVVSGIILASEKINNFKIYNIGEIEKKTYNEIIKLIAKNMNKKTIILHIPTVIAKTMGYFGDVITKITNKRFIINSRIIKGLLGGWKTSYNKAEKEIHLKQQYNSEEGIKETIEWLKKERMI